MPPLPGPRDPDPVKVRIVITLIAAAFETFTATLVLPSFPLWVAIADNIVLVILSVCTLVFLYLSQVADPGVISVKSTDPPTSAPPASKTRNVLTPDGSTMVTQKYCAACCTWRPPRAGHCYTCGHCVERFDHHCAVISSCVGAGNHRFFLGFLGFASVAGCLHFVTLLMWFLRLDPDDSSYWEEWRTYIYLAVIVVLAMFIQIMGFFVFHCAMVCCDITTKERFGSQHKQICTCAICDLGLSGYMAYCSNILCRPFVRKTPSSLVMTEVSPLVSTPRRLEGTMEV
eukprot:gnl/Hemi2/4419_TR1549_c0_g1_i1.p1 gnl/Hemi2/4419_TR1549_c0_g1~~gnl/Hemi2/4419_TR1549_c0_g1_i1.p1  ORF type:complete len:286 (+),score=25.48 gnl/Hemi2/4419_TR1549_c0_g1_i1:146-1003(+)